MLNINNNRPDSRREGGRFTKVVTGFVVGLSATAMYCVKLMAEASQIDGDQLLQNLQLLESHIPAILTAVGLCLFYYFSCIYV